MQRILIVDDEAVFRRGLRAMIASSDLDWEVVGDARDGYEALEMIESLKPDAILTDIRMPHMDGLQLQKIAREKFPRLNCIVISGYEDFTYVQQSMRSGARDYIMKPVEREELFRVLQRLQNEIQRNETQEEQKSASEQVIFQARQHVSDNLRAGLLRGSVHQHDLDLLSPLGIQLTEPYFNTLVINLDKESVGEERFKRTDPTLFQLYIQQFVQEIVSHRMNGFCFSFSDSKVAALINLPNPLEAQRRLLEMAESIRLQIKSLSSITVTIGVGRPVKGFESSPATLREAENALLYRLVAGGDKVIDYTTMQDPLMKSGLKKWSWEALQQTINEGRTEELSKRVENGVIELCRLAQTPELVHQQICKILIHYHELSEELGFTKEWLGDKDIRTLLLGICSISSSSELIEECRKLFYHLTVAISSCQRGMDRDPIELALRYMEQHHHEPITLKDIAEQVFLNPTYFSGLFKQRTGRSFIEHLTEMRIKDAKQRLISTEEKITNIAVETGFTNIRHFNRVFKNETRLTPKEYRDEKSH